MDLAEQVSEGAEPGAEHGERARRRVERSAQSRSFCVSQLVT